MDLFCTEQPGKEAEVASRQVDVSLGAEAETAKLTAATLSAPPEKPMEDDAVAFDVHSDDGYLDLKALCKAIRATGRPCTPLQASALMTKCARPAASTPTALRVL